jgi:aspartyl/asparaginyl-tRNA synthetase
VKINYNILAEALTHYKVCGYQEIDVPWLVSKEAVNITKPLTCRSFETFAGHLVGSGEQSLLEIRNLLNNQKYVCITPCFRDDERDDNLHFNYFMKVELMHVINDSFSLIQEKNALEDVINDAYNFMNNRMWKSNCTINRVATPDGIDININGIEVGSYGIRMIEGFKWIYGTGIAEPRFSQAISLRRS